MDTILRDAALIIIDVQKVLDDPDMDELNNPEAEQNIAKLLARWRREGRPLFHVKYISPRKESPFHQDGAGTAIKESVKPQPGETVIVKHFESAFYKTDLEERLRKADLDTLVFVGFYTDQCVAATVKVANNLGFKVFVAADATGTIGCRGHNDKYYEAEDIHQLTLGSLQRDGIAIRHTADLLKKL